MNLPVVITCIKIITYKASASSGPLLWQSIMNYYGKHNLHKTATMPPRSVFIYLLFSPF